MTEPDPAHGFKALTEFWSAQGAALLGMQQAATRSVMEGMQSMFGSGEAVGDLAASPELEKAGAAMAQLWSAATGLSTELASRLSHATDAGGAAAEMLDRISNPRYWLASTPEMDDILARMVDGPRLADLFDVERRYASVMRRWTDLRRCSVEHQRVLLEAWMHASHQFLTELSARAGTDGQSLEHQQLLALWTEIGNRQMLETHRSEAFLDSQRSLIRATTELRLAQAELNEHVGKQYGLPTRTEMDDVHRSITDLRREVRRTRRELDALKHAEPPAGPGKSAAPAPKKRKAR